MLWARKSLMKIGLFQIQASLKNIFSLIVFRHRLIWK